VLGIIAPLIDWLELISIAYASDLIDKEPKTPIETVSSLSKRRGEPRQEDLEPSIILTLSRFCPVPQGRSGVGRSRNVVAPTSLAGRFEQPYGPMGPPTLFTIPVLRYMKTYGLTHEQLAIVSVVQREWAAKNPRATPFRAPFTSRTHRRPPQ
jgi:hypothetical protein